MRIIQLITCFYLCVILAFCVTAMAEDAKPQQSVLIINANIFDGKSEQLATGMSVLIEGNKIAKIAKAITVPAGAMMINAQGRVLMPGLTDCHWHTIQANLTTAETLSSDLDYINLAAALGWFSRTV